MIRLPLPGVCAVLAIAGVGLLGCPPPVDYGSPCPLHSSDGGSVPQSTCDAARAAGGVATSLIDNASAACNDHVCVNTPAAPPGGYVDGGGSCFGYCSVSCLSDADCQGGSAKLVCCAINPSGGTGCDGGSSVCGTSKSYCVFPTDGGC